MKETAEQLATGPWQFVGAVPDGQPIRVGSLIFGVNVWKHQWETLNVSVRLPDRYYANQWNKLYVYRIKTNWRTIYFAAGEVSNCMWVFYVPTRSSDGVFSG